MVSTSALRVFPIDSACTRLRDHGDDGGDRNENDLSDGELEGCRSGLGDCEGRSGDCEGGSGDCKGVSC